MVNSITMMSIMTDCAQGLQNIQVPIKLPQVRLGAAATGPAPIAGAHAMLPLGHVICTMALMRSRLPDSSKTSRDAPAGKGTRELSKERSSHGPAWC